MKCTVAVAQYEPEVLDLARSIKKAVSIVQKAGSPPPPAPIGPAGRIGLLGMLAMMVGIAAPAAGQETDAHPYFRLPQEIPQASYHQLLQIGLAKLPEDVVEAASSAIRAPLFEYKAFYGLPSSFAVAGGASTNFVTFHFSLGPRWQYRMDEWSFAGGIDIAYWFGQIKSVEGFDTSIDGWLNYPNLTVGYRVDNVALTLVGELIYATSLTSRVGDSEVATESNFVGGYSVALYVEQPLWKDQYLLIGIKSNYARLYYPLWAAFSTFDRYFFIPELTVGFVL